LSSIPTVKLRVLVVDDEPLARNNLTSLLRADPRIDITESGSGADAIRQIRANHPDLLFIDVQMPECDGFDVLEILGGDLPPAVVFVTAYDHYALRAFEAGALDYLLKPFDDARFQLALSRARTRIEAGRGIPRNQERIAIKCAGEVLFLNTADIDWIEAADYYSCLHVRAKSHLLRRSMTELEQELDPALFCRIHRSCIVNLNRVKSLALSPQGEHEVVLEDGKHLPLSRRYREQLRDRLRLR
jgi:two-component system, LytTR family, response regulator